MFENVEMAPPDAIFGLNEALRQDPRPDKINLGAGVYKDEHGRTPVLDTVSEAERRLVEERPSKVYLPIEGHADYCRRVQELLFGAGHEILASGRAITVQTPGGTGALRVAGELLKALRGGEPTIWMSDPTWVNHGQIYGAVGARIRSYPYFDPDTRSLAFDRMTRALEAAEEGDLVLLHGCCHNPSGVDPSAEEWRRIGDLLAARGALPVVDFAYQGFGRGVREDAEWLEILHHRVPELVVCSSFSKNFGLYNERAGALTLVARTADHAERVLSQIKRTVRALYSNPPAHGAEVVAAILGDPELRRRWQEEVDGMRERIQRMRRRFADGLDARGVKIHPAGNDFIIRQHGMFSFSGLSPAQVARLRSEHGIFLVSSGRINVAGMTESNVDRLVDAIASVLGPVPETAGTAG
jgi:aspartate aminotransferase/aromatic-amino-acid transaminase